MSKVGIISLGSGNLGAIENNLRLLDANYRVISSPDFDDITHFVLPGVGSFDDYVYRLKDSGFYSVLIDLFNSGNLKLLGICVGMQVLANASEEGDFGGLGIIPGTFKRIPSPLETPHMGWNSLTLSGNDQIGCGVDLQRGAYYLHSYYLEPADRDSVVAYSSYGQIDIPGIIRSGNVYGMQFHPEKSHRNGLTFFKNFLEV